MNYTHAQQEEFQRQFGLRRRRQLLLAIPFIPILIGVLAIRGSGNGAVFGVPAEVWGPAFFVFAIGALLFSLWNWRCPACQKYLGKGMSPRFCPKCGVALQSDR